MEANIKTFGVFCIYVLAIVSCGDDDSIPFNSNTSQTTSSEQTSNGQTAETSAQECTDEKQVEGFLVITNTENVEQYIDAVGIEDCLTGSQYFSTIIADSSLSQGEYNDFTTLTGFPDSDCNSGFASLDRDFSYVFFRFSDNFLFQKGNLIRVYKAACDDAPFEPEKLSLKLSDRNGTIINSRFEHLGDGLFKLVGL